ncbi:MAG: hypothetical protein NTY45_02600 [Elusimicrobia bacterium]|nr:hypothetical protein [Elusimicrobiota bacterium]
MKRTFLALVVVMLGGAASAADFSGLQTTRVADFRAALAADKTFTAPLPQPAEEKGAAMTAAKKVGKMACTLDSKVLGNKEYTIIFNLKELAADPEGNPIRVVPAQNYLEALNENISVSEEKGNIVISGDSDGFFLVRLTLYSASGFAKGEFQLKDIGEGCGNIRSAVTCKAQN